jgi:hypothetical protein
VIINPHGLFERAFVFTQMTGIAHKTKTYPHSAEQNFTASAAAAAVATVRTLSRAAKSRKLWKCDCRNK